MIPENAIPRWWFRRCWKFRQTNGQMVCGGIAAIAIFSFIIAMDDLTFRIIVGLAFAFGAAEELAGLVKTNPDEETSE